MRKNPRFLVRLLLLSSLSALTVAYLAGCGGTTEKPEEGWTYIGTWVNPAYNGHGGGPPGKMVATATSMMLYNNDTDSSPAMTGSFAVAENWVSGGMHYFKGIVVISPDTYFFLLRVSGNNNTLESNSDSGAYPGSIDPAASQYGIFTRQ